MVMTKSKMANRYSPEVRARAVRSPSNEKWLKLALGAEQKLDASTMSLSRRGPKAANRGHFSLQGRFRDWSSDTLKNVQQLGPNTAFFECCS